MHVLSAAAAGFICNTVLVLVQLFEYIIMGASESEQERPKMYNNDDDDHAMSSRWDHLLSKERELVEREIGCQFKRSERAGDERGGGLQARGRFED